MNSVGSIEYRQNYGKYEISLPKSDCTGCAACMAICSESAISMEIDGEKGFLYPQIDMTQCTGCGRCEKICPASHLYEENAKYSEVYAANNKDKNMRHKSASGGVFPALAKTVLKQGGCVVGVAYTKSGTCNHVLIEREDELEDLCGTKYFQSDMSGIYEKIYKIAKENKNILFCGTPCQVRGVRNFAEMKGISNKLILTDLLCRGIPSPLVYQKYIEHVEKKYGKKIKHIHFKEKGNGWNKIGTMITFIDGSEIYEGQKESAFFEAFIGTDLSIRDSCFHCKYKTIHRESDLTIGDFWGLRHNHLLDNQGTSLILINTDIGKQLFENMKKDLDYVSSTMWRVYNGNGAAFHDVKCNFIKRSHFFKALQGGIDLRQAIGEVMTDGK